VAAAVRVESLKRDNADPEEVSAAKAHHTTCAVAARESTRSFYEQFPKETNSEVAAQREAARRVRAAALNEEQNWQAEKHAADRDELQSELRALLNDRSTEFRHLQGAAALAGLGKADVILQFPTAGGKSAAFQVPALVAKRRQGGATLVLQMQRSLITDQVRTLSRAYDNGPHLVFELQRIETSGSRESRMRTLTTKLPSAALIYTTPGK
jgi:ATP-dependent helicase YprA (DUF1998 family)